MTTAIDTNVIVALWDADLGATTAARTALEAAFQRGNLTVCPPVFAELVAAPGRTESFVNRFFEDTGIAIDWNLSEAIHGRAPVPCGVPKADHYAYLNRESTIGDAPLIFHGYLARASTSVISSGCSLSPIQS
jgi:hypothetical protein